MFEQLSKAIRSRQAVEFDYGGHRRVVHPWVVGTGQKGAAQLAGQQVAGSSSSGGPGFGEPKLFALAGISRLVVTETTFDVPAVYRKGDSRFRSIDEQL